MSDLTQLTEGGKAAIVIRPGRTLHERFWLREADGITPISLDGWAGAAQMRDVDDRLMLAMTVVVSQEIDPDDPECGQVDVEATATATKVVTRAGLWELVLTRGSGPSFETREFFAPSDALLGAVVTQL